jgi:hypothetical protein
MVMGMGLQGGNYSIIEGRIQSEETEDYSIKTQTIQPRIWPRTEVSAYQTQFYCVIIIETGSVLHLFERKESI